MRSNIELQSILRYRQDKSRCANREVHIERLGLPPILGIGVDIERKRDTEFRGGSENSRRKLKTIIARTV